MTAYSQWLIIFLYLALFFFVVGALVYWKRKGRKVRAPLAFKLLRGPGESLRRRIVAFEENFPLYIMGAAGAPLFVFLICARLAVYIHTELGLDVRVVIPVMLLLIGLTFFFSVRWLTRAILRVSNERLGYLGEREVAEHLTVLWARGYRIFHDVPAESGGKAFNLDHVVVGPAGVAVVEVKARRKGRARPGYKEHVVTFDGRQLIWPWGEDTKQVSQCLAEVAWLQTWIEQRTGIAAPIKSILAIPGWWVEQKAVGDVRVVNSKAVAAAVEGRGPQRLTDEQIDLIARQLDVICRDVDA